MSTGVTSYGSVNAVITGVRIAMAICFILATLKGELSVRKESGPTITLLGSQVVLLEITYFPLTSIARRTPKQGVIAVMSLTLYIFYTIAVVLH